MIIDLFTVKKMVKMEEKNMPRKGENIYKRKDGRWEARYIYAFKEDGSPRYRSIYAADYLIRQVLQAEVRTVRLFLLHLMRFSAQIFPMTSFAISVLKSALMFRFALRAVLSWRKVLATCFIRLSRFVSALF